MTKMVFLLLALLASFPASGNDLSKSFPVGRGSRFELKMDGMVSEVAISVSESTKQRVGIEYFFSSPSTALPVQLWQQFIFEKAPNTNLHIVAGFHYANELSSPESIPEEKLQLLQQMGIGDFILRSEKDLKQIRIGEEVVTTPAGKVKATHYRQSRDGSTTDYWLSEAAQPIGLVQLRSTGKLSYQMSLKSLLQNVQRKINPKSVSPPSEKGKQLLQLMGTPLP